MGESIRLPLFAALVVFLGALIYWPGLSGPLLFDDKSALTENELVKIDGSSFDQWRTAALSSNSGPLRRPVAMLSFAANHALSGELSTVALKATNLAIHLSIAFVLYFLFLAILEALKIGSDDKSRQLVALTAAAIWLLHPLNVSTVLYAVQRMAQLAALFVVAGLLLFMRYRQRWARHGASTGELMAATLWLLLLCAMAALSKENGTLLPWLIIVLEVCIFRGVWAGKSCTLRWSVGWILLLLPIVLVLIVLAIKPGALLGGYAGREFSLEERLLTQSRILWRYLGWICLPNINDMGFQHDHIPLSSGLFAPLSTLVSVLAWPLALVFAWLLRRRYPLVLLALLFFLVGQSMESSLWPLEMVYEHRNYLPAMLVCLALSALLVIPATHSSAVSVWYPVAGTVAMLCLLLFSRVGTWSDELTLTRSNALRHPESSRSNYLYANALLRHYRRAEQRGLSQRERSDALLLSRHYFERMYQTNNRDVAALVMLYYLDSRHFTDLQQQVDWLAILEALLETRAMQPSDWNALATLFAALAAEVDRTDEVRVTALLDKLSLRYPESLEVQRYRYQIRSSMAADSDELLGILRRAQEIAPGDAWIYYHLLYEYGRVQDSPAMYHYSRLWLLNDSKRLHLGQLKSLFSQASSAVHGAHD
jgi:protein O-mannosyl-transferase